eukprot:8634667-Pyramimonas_sp.AAC.1
MVGDGMGGDGTPAAHPHHPLWRPFDPLPVPPGGEAFSAPSASSTSSGLLAPTLHYCPHTCLLYTSPSPRDRSLS